MSSRSCRCDRNLYTPFNAKFNYGMTDPLSATAPLKKHPFDSRTSPNRLEPHSGTEMLIGWSTGASFAVPYFELRFYCPCANCVDEHTGVRTLKRENVAADVRPLEVHAVGRYAIQFTWSDKHSTGMYPYDLLYSICLEKGLPLS